MEYCRDLDDIIAQAVDDSIVAVDDLTNRLVAELRYDTSRARVILKPFNGRDEPFNDEIGIASRVAGDMRVSPRRHGLPEAPRLPGSPEKSTLRLSVIDAMPSIQLRQPALSLCQEH